MISASYILAAMLAVIALVTVGPDLLNAIRVKRGAGPSVDLWQPPEPDINEPEVIEIPDEPQQTGSWPASEHLGDTCPGKADGAAERELVRSLGITDIEWAEERLHTLTDLIEQCESNGAKSAASRLRAVAAILVAEDLIPLYKQGGVT